MSMEVTDFSRLQFSAILWTGNINQEDKQLELNSEHYSTDNKDIITLVTEWIWSVVKGIITSGIQIWWGGNVMSPDYTG